MGTWASKRKQRNVTLKGGGRTTLDLNQGLEPRFWDTGILRYGNGNGSLSCTWCALSFPQTALRYHGGKTEQEISGLTGRGYCQESSNVPAVWLKPASIWITSATAMQTGALGAMFGTLLFRARLLIHKCQVTSYRCCPRSRCLS